MKRFAIVYPPIISWQEVIFQRPHQLMAEFARQGNLAIFINREPDGKGLYWFADQNLCIANDLGSALCDPVLQELRQGTSLVFWVTYPGLMKLKAEVKPDLIVFDYIDESVEEFAFWQEGLKEAMADADLIFASSEKLLGLVEADYPDKTFLVRNGADTRKFTPKVWGIPADLKRIKNTHSLLVGFHGSLQSWLDYPLIRDIALARPRWAIVLLGPELFPESICHGIPNVYFLGSRNYELLPAYVKNFDVGIIPFQVREMTNSANPIKMYEYLAVGVPVVATPIRECLKLAPYIRTAGDSAGFISQIEAVVKAKPQEKASYCQIASQNSWTSRVKDILAILGESR